ncbi:MAG TPA: Flp pilus assembly protein CpaB [Micromonosporaceae bacterium]
MIRRVLAIVIAVVLAVLGTTIVLGYVSYADARAIAGKKAVTVMVAKQRIPAGTSGARIRADGLAEPVRMPAETVPPGTLDQVGQELDDLVVTSDVQGSQLLLRGMFGDAVKSTGGLAIPEGKMAVSVQLLSPEQVAGFVRPGATIAIFDTFTMAGNNRVPSGEGLGRAKSDNHATRVLLPRVEVLAVGTYGVEGTRTSNGKTTRRASTGSRSDSGQAAVLVTVAVTQSEAERLVHAVRTGTLYLALVTESTDIEPGAGVDNRSLFK